MKRTTITMGMLLYAGTAMAATSGTPLDTVATQVYALCPTIAVILIALGLVGGIGMFLWRHSVGEALGTLAGAVIIGCFVANIQTFMTFFFPLAAAVIR